MSQFIYPNFPLARPNIWHIERGGGIFKSEPEQDLGAATTTDTWENHTSGESFIPWAASTNYINSAADLAQLAKDVSGGKNYSGVNFIQSADINLGQYQWAPIGNAAYPFSGSYNGNGYKIYGLNINTTNTYQGLFAYTGSSASVTNVTLEGGYVKGSNYVGSLVGYAQGNISNCSSNVNVTGNDNVGGIFGYLSAGINKCKYTGSVTGTNYVGGLCGSRGYSSPNTTDYCECYATVTGENHVGGLSGWLSNAGMVTKSIFVGNVYGVSDVGGLAGGTSASGLQLCIGFGHIQHDASYPAGAIFGNGRSSFAYECAFFGSSNGDINMWGGDSTPMTLIACWMWCNDVKQCSTATNTTNYWSQYWSIVPNMNNGMPIQKELFSVANGVSTPESSLTSYFSSWTKV